MRRIVFLIALPLSILLLLWTESIYASGQNPKITGRVVDENKESLSYATVVLLSAADSTQVAGAASDEDGRFVLSAPKGRYHIRFYYLGHSDRRQEATLDGDLDIGTVAMRRAATDAGTVTITPRTITREADRFIVTVANNPAAIGKNAFEMLKLSPGVWVTADGITINGRPNTKVLINDRQIRMDGGQLETYLKGINAEDIIKIEVIPDSGADYDADSSGGIIKITLRRQRDDGIDGSISLYGNVGYWGNFSAGPSANVNYKRGKFSLYANLGYSYNKEFIRADEKTTYEKTSLVPGIIRTTADMTSRGNGANGLFGAFYDINSKHNIGLELGVNGRRDNVGTTGSGTYAYDPPIRIGMITIDSTANTSLYGTTGDRIYYSGTLNYIYKLDNKGSMFKVIGDFVQSVNNTPNSYKSRRTDYMGAAGIAADTLYRSTSDANYRIMSLTANVDFNITRKMVVQAGAKYTNNNMLSELIYSDWDPGRKIWNIIPAFSSTTDYTENIAAVYAIYRGMVWKLNISAGLRGEYTFMNPRYKEVGSDGNRVELGSVRQCYFDLFPNVNVSVPLNSSRSNSLVLAFSRSIYRPHFSYLSPFRNPLSDYSVIEGNPKLKAMYNNTLSLTGIFAHKYSITLAAAMMENQIMQKVIPDNGMLVYRFVNIPRTWQYIVMANAPVTFTKWWSATFNLTAGDIQQRMETDGPIRRKLFGMLRANMTFSLPKQFDIEVGGWGQTRIISANMEVLPMYNVNVSAKKRFAKNRFTASLGVNNLLNVGQKVYSYGQGFHKWAFLSDSNYLTVNFSLRYNFSAGKKFGARKVEKGSEEDTQRIGDGKQ